MKVGPDPPCLLQHVQTALRVGLDRTFQFESTSEAGAVPARSGNARGLDRGAHCVLLVPPRQLHPPLCQERIGIAHGRRHRRRPLGMGRGQLRLVVGENASEAGERGHEGLQICRLTGEVGRLLVRRPRQRGRTACRVDVTEESEWIRLESRTHRAEDPPRLLEVGDGFVDCAEGEACLSSVREAQRPPQLEPARLGQLKGDVELLLTALVVALLDVARPTVAADADRLNDVSGAFGVLEGAHIMGVVRHDVAIERRHHRQHGVRGGQCPRVVRPPGESRRLIGERARLVALDAEEVGTRRPGEQRRLVGGPAFSARPPSIGCEGRLDVAAHVVEQSRAPRQIGGDRPGGRRDRVVGVGSTVPVTVHLSGIGLEQREGAVVLLCRDGGKGVEHLPRPPLGDHRRAVVGEELDEPSDLVARPVTTGGLAPRPTVPIPVGRRAAGCLALLRRQRLALTNEVDDQGRDGNGTGFGGDGGDVDRRTGEDLRCFAVEAELHRQLACHPGQLRGDAQGMHHGGRLVRGDLLGEVAEHSVVGGRGEQRSRGAVRRGEVADGVCRERGCDRPSTGVGDNLVDECRIGVGTEELGHLVWPERQLMLVDAARLAFQLEPAGGKRQLGARGDHEVERGRRMAGEPVEHRGRFWCARQVLCIVDHHDDVSSGELAFQLLTHQRGERSGPRSHGISGCAPDTFDCEHQVGRNSRYSRNDRVEHTAGERHESFAHSDCVPSDVTVSCPLGERSRLPRAGRTHEQGQSRRERDVEQRLQAAPTNRFRWRGMRYGGPPPVHANSIAETGITRRSAATLASPSWILQGPVVLVPM